MDGSIRLSAAAESNLNVDLTREQMEQEELEDLNDTAENDEGAAEEDCTDVEEHAPVRHAAAAGTSMRERRSERQRDEAKTRERKQTYLNIAVYV